MKYVLIFYMIYGLGACLTILAGLVYATWPYWGEDSSVSCFDELQDSPNEEA